MSELRRALDQLADMKLDTSLSRRGEMAMAASRLIRAIEQVPDSEDVRGGLEETPDRVAKAWEFWTSGYGMDPAEILKVFDDGGEQYDEMVTVRNIPFYSHCEHHMAPFFGSVTLSYIPNEKKQQIIGLSKASRLVDVFARRLQVQERLTVQIVDALDKHLSPLGVGVVITARHMCMESRGISKQGITTSTCAVRGIFKSDHMVRAEFLQLAR